MKGQWWMKKMKMMLWWRISDRKVLGKVRYPAWRVFYTVCMIPPAGNLRDDYLSEWHSSSISQSVSLTHNSQPFPHRGGMKIQGISYLPPFISSIG